MLRFLAACTLAVTPHSMRDTKHLHAASRTRIGALCNGLAQHAGLARMLRCSKRLTTTPQGREKSMNAATFVAGARMASPASGTVAAIADAMVLRLNQLVALVLLVLLGPLMAVVTFLIWRRDGAPVLFAHYRVGQGGKLFRCMKFRTMLRNSEQVLSDLLRDDPQARAEWARDQKLANDPRITPVGHFLRKSSLDEL